MNMTTVDSSQIHSIGHLPEENRLFVRFHSGSTYSYENVPEPLFQELRNSKSVGNFFGKHFKNNPAHPFKKLEPSEAPTAVSPALKPHG